MGKSRTIDPGLQYLQEIGFERIRGKYGLSNRLIKVFGRTKAEQLFDKAGTIPGGSAEFYEFKNSDPEICKSLSEAFDGDIIREACNYIDSHREYFGKTILEVGCESGYMTCFLAKTFPDSKIVSIDRCNAAINLATKKTQAMGIKNVEFRSVSLDVISGEKFDTVFCMRTIQENINGKNTLFVGEPVLAQIYQCADLTEHYSKLLTSCLKEDGHLFVFERIGHDPLLCGWMMKLCCLNCAPIIDTCAEVECEEAGQINTFYAFICRNGTTVAIQNIVTWWSDAFNINPAGESELSGWYALGYLNDNAGQLIRGVRIFDDKGEQIGRFAAFYDKDGEPIVYYLYAAGGSEVKVFSTNISDKDVVLKDLQKVIDVNIKAGFHFEEIAPNEEILEGRFTGQSLND